MARICGQGVPKGLFFGSWCDRSARVAFWPVFAVSLTPPALLAIHSRLLKAAQYCTKASCQLQRMSKRAHEVLALLSKTAGGLRPLTSGVCQGPAALSSSRLCMTWPCIEVLHLPTLAPFPAREHTRRTQPAMSSDPSSALPTLATQLSSAYAAGAAIAPEDRIIHLRKLIATAAAGKHDVSKESVLLLTDQKLELLVQHDLTTSDVLQHSTYDELVAAGVSLGAAKVLKLLFPGATEGAAQAGASSAAPTAYQRFLKLLRETCYNNPREDVLTIVRQQLASSMIACATPDDAATVYEAARALPSEDTKKHFYTQHELNVNGLLFPGGDGPLSILTAMDRNGVPKAVKLLSPRLDLPGCEPPEATVVKTLCTAAIAKDFAIAPAVVIEIELTRDHTATTRRPPGRYAALVMDRYLTSVAKSIQIPIAAIAAQGQRMLKAVEYLHQNGFVHMDIKLDNFFMDSEGQWHLGDFGSCVREGDAITSTTSIMNPKIHLINKPALPWYDHHMLGVALMTAVLGEDKWKEQLVENGCVPPHTLRAAVSAMNDTEGHSQLKKLLEALLIKCQTTAGYSPA